MILSVFCALLTARPGMILVNNQLDTQFIMYVYFYSLHVSGSHVPIIRRINCINAIPGICHSVWTTVWYAGWDENSVFIPTCIPHGLILSTYFTQPLLYSSIHLLKYTVFYVYPFSVFSVSIFVSSCQSEDC